MAIVKFLPFISAIQYNGTNSAEILGYVADYVPDTGPTRVAFILSEGGGSVSFRQTVRDNNIVTITMDVGDWMKMDVTGWDDLENFSAFRSADGNPITLNYVQAPS